MDLADVPDSMLFFTGKGDRGSSVIGKKRYPKDSPVLEVLGELDELNSFIGLVRTRSKRRELSGKLKVIQETIFIIQARMAWFLYQKFTPPEVKDAAIEKLEQEIIKAEKTIRPKHGFVIAGSNEVSSWFDVLRAIVRRVERRMFAYSRQKRIPQNILKYLNRLSSYFYALARLEAHRKKIKELRPRYK